MFSCVNVHVSSALIEESKCIQRWRGESRAVGFSLECHHDEKMHPHWFGVLWGGTNKHLHELVYLKNKGKSDGEWWSRILKGKESFFHLQVESVKRKTNHFWLIEQQTGMETWLSWWCNFLWRYRNIAFTSMDYCQVISNLQDRCETVWVLRGVTVRVWAKTATSASLSTSDILWIIWGTAGWRVANRDSLLSFF